MPEGAQGLKENERKWSKVLMDAGWTAIPSIILERQQALKLKPIDICILMHLVKHWWRADSLPFPSKRSIAECMGVSPSTVQRRIRILENANLVRREIRTDTGGHQGQMSNRYDFSGLIRAATPLAEESQRARVAKREEASERRRRRRPVQDQ